MQVDRPSRLVWSHRSTIDHVEYSAPYISFMPEDPTHTVSQSMYVVAIPADCK